MVMNHRYPRLQSKGHELLFSFTLIGQKYLLSMTTHHKVKIFIYRFTFYLIIIVSKSLIYLHIYLIVVIIHVYRTLMPCVVFSRKMECVLNWKIMDIRACQCHNILQRLPMIMK